jgi:hypothetical protein
MAFCLQPRWESLEACHLHCVRQRCPSLPRYGNREQSRGRRVHSGLQQHFKHWLPFKSFPSRSSYFDNSNRRTENVRLSRSSSADHPMKPVLNCVRYACASRMGPWIVQVVFSACGFRDRDRDIPDAPSAVASLRAIEFPPWLTKEAHTWRAARAAKHRSRLIGGETADRPSVIWRTVLPFL